MTSKGNNSDTGVRRSVRRSSEVVFFAPAIGIPKHVVVHLTRLQTKKRDKSFTNNVEAISTIAI